MAVLAIVLGIVVPRIDVTDSRLRAATQEVSVTLLKAQRTAMTRQHDVVLAFDVSNRRIRVHEDSNNNGVIDEGERVTYVAFDEDIAFSLGGAPARDFGDDALGFTQEQDDLPALTYHRNGSASESTGFYFTSRRSAVAGIRPSDTRAVEITRATGRASWYRYDGSDWHRGF